MRIDLVKIVTYPEDHHHQYQLDPLTLKVVEAVIPHIKMFYFCVSIIY